jgi:tRNA(fMet)-specific endonuclease VapC
MACTLQGGYEKARLRKSGKPVDDFDLLIGSTAIANDLILVTNNTKHFENLKRIKLDNWIKQSRATTIKP